MKRIGILCLTFVLLVSILPREVSAAAECVTGKHGDNITWTFDPASGTLTISGQGDMVTLDRNSDYPWDMFRSDTKKLVVEPGVTSIADSAFRGSNIETVQLPMGLERIEAMAFLNCDLTAVTLPAGLKVIGESAFQDCRDLKKVVFPDSLEHIGERAFLRCYDLEELQLPDRLEAIGRSVFYDCRSLTRVEFPRELKTIGYMAFFGCTSLKELFFPERLRVIENEAFFGCEELIKVTFPEGLRLIHNEAFRKCVNLKDVTLPQSVYVCSAAFEGCGEIPVVEQQLERQRTAIYGSVALCAAALLVCAVLDGINHRRRRFWRQVAICLGMTVLIYAMWWVIGKIDPPSGSHLMWLASLLPEPWDEIVVEYLKQLCQLVYIALVLLGIGAYQYFVGGAWLRAAQRLPRFSSLAQALVLGVNLLVLGGLIRLAWQSQTEDWIMSWYVKIGCYNTECTDLKYFLIPIAGMILGWAALILSRCRESKQET